MAPFFPPSLRQTYYTPTNTQPQSITFPRHVHMPTQYRDGYIFSRGCIQTYLCVRRREGCWRWRRGWGGRTVGVAVLENSSGRGIMGKSAARIRSFTSEGEESDLPCWDYRQKFNLPSFLLQSWHRKAWRWPLKLPNSKPKRGGNWDPTGWIDPHLKEKREAMTRDPIRDG